MKPHRSSPVVHASIPALIQAAPALERYRSWLTRAHTALNPPSVAMVLPALVQLRALADTVGWALPFVSTFPARELDSVLDALRAAPGMNVPRMDTRDLAGAYPTWVTMITHSPQPDGYSCMHALFIQYACVAGERSIRLFASAIRHRGAVRRASKSQESLVEILHDVGPAENAQDYFERLSLHSGRIKRTKPQFAQVLFEELPDMLGLEMPNSDKPIEGSPKTPVSVR